MPIESSDPANRPQTADVGTAFLQEARDTLRTSLRKISHCLAQLRDEDLWWRGHESHNSIENVILHLCGNLRQWFLHGLGGEADVRDRPSEFSDREQSAKSDLLARLTEVLQKSDAVLRGFPPDRLLETRRIQGFEVSALAAIFETVSHFVGHTHQIVYVTRLRLGDAYRFEWTPATAEQGASGPRSG